MPDVPPINEVFRNLEVSSNLHLITEEPYTSAIEHLVKRKNYFFSRGTNYADVIYNNKMLLCVYVMYDLYCITEIYNIILFKYRCKMK